MYTFKCQKYQTK